MAPFYLALVRYVNTTRIAPEKKSVQVSLPRAIYINNCTLLKSMNCDQNV